GCRRLLGGQRLSRNYPNLPISVHHHLADFHAGRGYSLHRAGDIALLESLATAAHLKASRTVPLSRTPKETGQWDSGNGGKSRGGKIIRFPLSDESDSLWGWCRPRTWTIFHTPSSKTWWWPCLNRWRSCGERLPHKPTRLPG